MFQSFNGRQPIEQYVLMDDMTKKNALCTSAVFDFATGVSCITRITKPCKKAPLVCTCNAVKCAFRMLLTRRHFSKNTIAGILQLLKFLP